MQYFVDLEVQNSWQVQYFVELEMRIAWQVQYSVDLEVQVSWQASLLGEPAESLQRNMVDFEGVLGPILREFWGT